MKAVVFALGLALLSPAAFADADVDAISEGAPSEAQSTDAEPAVAAQAEKADKSAKNADRNCIRETGTRIASRDKHGCNGLPGRSYDRDDLDRTGAINVADALEKLDPSVTVRR